MNAETNLQKLLATMEPVLHPDEFVFTTISPSEYQKLSLEPWGWFCEPEGLTLILEKSAATATGVDQVFPSRLITLMVHSSLEAVGFLAVITEHLAGAGISVNVVSAYYHDHLFVPAGKAPQALDILHSLMRQASSQEGQPD